MPVTATHPWRMTQTLNPLAARRDCPENRCLRPRDAGSADVAVHLLLLLLVFHTYVCAIATCQYVAIAWFVA